MPLEKALEQFAPSSPQRWMLYEHAHTPLARDLRTCDGQLGAVFVIGPEGGFDEGEVAMAEKQGYPARLIAAPILRAETAPTCVLGAWACLAATAADR
jgi:16S rRNA (uracil1498-N3)-methyltransferase